MKKEPVEKDTEWGGGTSPSKVYAKSEPTDDFLLDAGSVEVDPKISEIGLELLGRLEGDGGHAEASSRLRIGGNVVYVYGLLGLHLSSLEGGAVDERVGLAGADKVGIDANGEEAEEGEAGVLV
jgi:hypothetical protein